MYTTNNEIELRLGTARYIQLTDDAGTGSANEAVVDEARLGAEGEVDSYLAQRYAVPIDLAQHPQVAAVLKSLTLDLVEHRLYGRRPPIPSDILAKRDAALIHLQRVARGEAMLPAAGEIESNPASGIRAAAIGDERILSRDELADF